MSANEEQNIECPLCMEPLEMDDINFFPCTCGYQICRFCWHRIRTDENGLCPACRKQYPEDPADFKPLSQEELQKIKNDKKQKDLQRKHKISENRKHLANVRVVQKNLVFVVGLSQRLADPEVLKKHEYFGKFGKIHKVVINHSTSYAGSQGPSASAYVTYNRAEDALRAIQAVNNIYVDGRTLKASLGTTKYCSHFLKNQQCPKPDCMYLHELGDEAASFTKEEMQQGKHQEYEKKLHEQLFNSVQNHLDKNKEQIRKQAASPTIPTQQIQPQLQPSPQPQSTQHSLVHPLSTCSKEAWPCLNSGSNCKSDRPTSGNKTSQNGHRPIVDTQGGTLNSRGSGGNNSSGNTDHVRHRNSSTEEQFKNCKIQENPPSESQTVSGQQISQYSSQSPSTPPIPTTILQPHSPPRSHSHAPPSPPVQSQVNRTKSPFENTESHSLFSSTSGFPNHSAKVSVPINNSTDWLSNTIDQTPLITADTIQVSSTTDWQAAFGFGSSQRQQDDDLGFDPWNESSKALADLIEKESGVNSYKTQYHHHHHHHHHPQLSHHTQSQHSEHNSLFTGVHLRSSPLDRSATDQQKRHSVPPGFSINNHFTSVYSMNARQPYANHDLSSSKMSFLNLSQPSTGSSLPTYHDVLSDIGLTNHVRENHSLNSRNKDVFNAKDWQEGLRALLPNINISFGSSTNLQSNSQGTSKVYYDLDWSSLPQDRSWLAQDPAIVTGQITDSSSLSDSSTPHWMKSLQQLTEIEPFHYNGRTVPFATQYTYRAPPWPATMQSPPPGFSAQVTSTEPQKIQNL